MWYILPTSYSQCSNLHLLYPGSDVCHLHPQLREQVFKHFFQHLSQNYSVVQLLGETNARFPKERMHHLASELQLSGSVP